MGGGWWEKWSIKKEVFHLFQLFLEEGGHSFQVREAVTCQGLSSPWEPALQGSPKDFIGAQGGRSQGEFPIVYEPAQPASWEQGLVQLQPQGRQE